jgi:hypothetical protein
LLSSSENSASVAAQQIRIFPSSTLSTLKQFRGVTVYLTIRQWSAPVLRRYHSTRRRLRVCWGCVYPSITVCRIDPAGTRCLLTCYIYSFRIHTFTEPCFRTTNWEIFHLHIHKSFHDALPSTPRIYVRYCVASRHKVQ